MHLIIGLVTLIVGFALALRIIKWALKFTYNYAPFVFIWGVIIMVLFNVGYFNPIKKDMKDIHAEIVKSIKD